MSKQSILLAALIGLVGLVVVVALWQHGSPQNARLRDQDQERVRDLQSIARVATTYAQREGSLAPTLDALRGDNLWRQLRVDPATGERFEYRPLGSDQFEICATFATEESNDSEWAHGIGRQCFERVLDRKK